MSRSRLFLAALVITAGAYARAGGGGSYRSSSSSSSRSSSSSSSRSSSSSSSYRSSSSSSSYRSSSSSSSSYRSGSSGSSYSGPSYVTLRTAKSLTRIYSFERLGHVSIAQNFKFAYKDTKSDGYQIGYGAPITPQEHVSFTYDKNQFNYAYLSSDLFQFKPKSTTAGDFSVSFLSVLSFAPTPTRSGILFDLEPDCAGAPDCTLHFTKLPPLTKIQLKAKRNTETGFLAVKTEKTGSHIELRGADLAGISEIRLLIPGEEYRSAAEASWSKAELVSESEPTYRIDADSIVHINTKLSFNKPRDNPHLVIPRGPASNQHYLVAQLRGFNFSYMSEYSESHLNLSANATEYSYDVMDAVTKLPSGKAITLPVPAVNPNGYALTKHQDKVSYVTWQKQIQVEMPPGVPARLSLIECRNLVAATCSRYEHVAAEQKIAGNRITLVPQQAQLTGLWLLIIELPDGSLKDPGFLKRAYFSFVHYHEFGRYPRWVFWFYFLTIIGIIVGLIVFFVKLGSIKRKRAARKQAHAIEDNAIRDLLKRDPGFSIEKFKERGRHIAERIQHAWCAGDMRECRRFLSQGVYNRFRMQLKIMRELEKRQNAMADFKIHAFNIAARQRSGPYDAIVVRLDAEARDTMVSVDATPAEALAAAKKAPRNGFIEYYTFMRRRDAQTGKSSALDACNRCGTPFTAEGEITKCKSCGSVMGSGTYDWVLAEITQEVEYKPHARRPKPGEDISPDRIEDRASFVFWRDVMTRITGEAVYIQRDATAGYLNNPREKTGLYDIAVGAAELENFDNQAEIAHARVRIKWSAAAQKGSEVRHRESILELSADKSALSGSGFAEHSCPTCGAPLPESDSETCSYCRSPIQAKNPDWLLAHVHTTVE